MALSIDTPLCDPRRLRARGYDGPVLRAILFDFNGVLLDDEGVHFELFRRILGELGIELDEGVYYRDYVGFDDEAGFAHALRGREDQADDLLLRRLCARKAAYYQEHFRQHPYPFFPGAARLVREASGAGVDLGIVSGALRSEIEPALRQEDLLGYFKVIVAAEDTQTSKPDPDGYLLAMSLLNSRQPLPERLLHPHEVLAIEDTEAGLQAASAAGLLTLAVSHTQPPAALGRADLVVERLADLSLAELSGRLLEVSRR
ncbi:MAG TPA: HAD family phosphatase [Thermoanaerobaculia bacterium]|nr:HAD family phosphatase [Thermoanaerobaculia bacterium]